jgi:hypothetical protein
LKGSNKNSLARSAQRNLPLPERALNWLFLLCVSLLVANALPALAQSQQPTDTTTTKEGQPAAPQTQAPSVQPGSITGTVLDKDEAMVPNAKITLTQSGTTTSREVLSGSDGQFIFINVPPGPFQLAVTATGFAAKQQSGVLQPGQNYVFPEIQMAIALAVLDIDVKVQPVEVAEEEIHVEEKQRILGMIPNYFVSYTPNAVPLIKKQKFELAWKSTIDPVSFGLAGVVAGIEQGTNSLSGYGQGAQGYAKRFGATYADFAIGTFVGSAILPSILKQDPRYFYKGTGSKKSRLLYALANAVICKGDNGHWQPNYSNMLGGLAAGAISNLYYPSSDRTGASVTFENAMIGIGGTAAGAVVQEFFIRKLTPHAPPPVPDNY